MLVGVLVGAGLVLVVVLLRRRPAQALAAELLRQAEQEKLQDLQNIITQLQGHFSELSRSALAANNEQFLQLAETKFAAQTKQSEATLEGRKRLIDETVKQIQTRLTEVGTTLATMDKERRATSDTLVARLDVATKATTELRATTDQLRQALADPKRRGQWGERMAEDILRLAGFIEGVNYHKELTGASGSRPDFTFPLPRGHIVNMDVKFPLPNYLRYLDAEEDGPREQFKSAFVRDVRTRIKEVTSREYIDPTAGTVDYVLVFIPNEQLYAFIHEADASLLDDALRQKVVLCSPLTLYAILAVIRQVSESFHLEQASREILTLLEAFNKEWGKYAELTDRLGKSLEQVMKHYEALTTTRTRQLQRQLDRIEDLRSRKNLPLPEGPVGGAADES